MTIANPGGAAMIGVGDTVLCAMKAVEKITAEMKPSR
jgi:hypothetical protein